METNKEMKEIHFKVSLEMVQAILENKELHFRNDNVHIIFHPVNANKVTLSRDEYEQLKRSTYRMGAIDTLENILDGNSLKTALNIFELQSISKDRLEEDLVRIGDLYKELIKTYKDLNKKKPPNGREE